MKNKQFEIGKTYFSMTRSGKVKTFILIGTLGNKGMSPGVIIVAN